jgi:hypothetical protein
MPPTNEVAFPYDVRAGVFTAKFYIFAEKFLAPSATLKLFALAPSDDAHRKLLNSLKPILIRQGKCIMLIRPDFMLG